MTTTVTETGPFERIVRFQLSEDQIAEAKKGAARRLSHEVKIKGFRPGKAPLPIVEKTVGADRVRREAIDDLLNPALNEVLTEEEIRPALNPELEGLDEVEGGVEVEVKVTLWPTIDLPNYKDRRIEVTNPEVTEDDVERQITRMLEQFATVEEVERPAAEGDFVSIDIGATGEGEPVEDAKASDLLYEVGSGSFIGGIDEHLIGASAGDELSFEGPLPEGFGDAEGETVTFSVTVHEVKERVLPELDDDWVDENTEFETVDELTAALRDGLATAKRRAVAREFQDKAVGTLRDQVDVELPDRLVRAEMENQFHRFVHRLEENELTLEDYFQASGVTQESFMADLQQQAELTLRNRLLLEAVAAEEEIEVTAEDLTRALRNLAAMSEDPTAFLEAFRESGQELALAGDIVRERALAAILDNAIAVDEDGNRVDLSTEVSEVEAEIVDGAVEGEVVTAEIVEEEE
ncbi:MAG: trigger factor [Actinobacteria bacterium]|nr:trigger factor [Actinomycetota bacterium]